MGGQKQPTALALSGGGPALAAAEPAHGSAAAVPVGVSSVRPPSAPPLIPAASSIESAALEHGEAVHSDMGGYVDEDSFLGDDIRYDDDDDSFAADGEYYNEDGEGSDAESSGSEEERNAALRMVMDDMLMP